MLTALLFDQLKNPAHILFVGENSSRDNRLFNLVDLARVRPARGIINFHDAAIGECDLVADARSGSNEVEIVFALQSLLNNFHVQQAKEAATEAEAERGRAFRFEEERRVVEA